MQGKGFVSLPVGGSPYPFPSVPIDLHAIGIAAEEVGGGVAIGIGGGDGVDLRRGRVDVQNRWGRSDHRSLGSPPPESSPTKSCSPVG